MSALTDGCKRRTMTEGSQTISRVLLRERRKTLNFGLVAQGSEGRSLVVVGANRRLG